MNHAQELVDRISNLREKCSVLEDRKKAVIKVKKKLTSIEKQVGGNSALSRILNDAFDELHNGALSGTVHLSSLWFAHRGANNTDLYGVRDTTCSSCLDDEIDRCIKEYDSLSEEIGELVAEYNNLC